MTDETVWRRALLPLPNSGELLLTDLELQSLSGAQQYRLQIDWLTDNGWVFFRTRAGRPVVGRLYANLKLANVELKQVWECRRFELDLTAING